MSLTALDLIKRVKTVTDQTNTTQVGQLDSGTSPMPTLTTDQNLLGYLNEGLANLCKSVWPLVSTSVVSVPSGATQVAYASITDTDGRIMHRAQRVTSTYGRLEEMAYGKLGDWGEVTGNVPNQWANQPNFAIQFGVPFGGTTSITVLGFYVPKPFTATGDPVDANITDDQSWVAVQWAAYRLAGMNANDDSLAPRIKSLYDQYRLMQANEYTRVIGSQPDMQVWFPPLPDFTKG